MRDAFGAAPFKQIPPYNFRPMKSDKTATLVIDGGTVTVTAAGAPP